MLCKLRSLYPPAVLIVVGLAIVAANYLRPAVAARPAAVICPCGCKPDPYGECQCVKCPRCK